MVLRGVTGIAVLLLATGCRSSPTPSTQIKGGRSEMPLQQEEPSVVQVKPDSKPTTMPKPPATLVGIVPVRTVRTTDSTPRVEVRIDNGSSTEARIKLLSASYIPTIDAPSRKVGVLALEVANVPVGENTPDTAVTRPSRSTWIDVPPSQSRRITITLDHNLPYAPIQLHHYLLSLTHGNGMKTKVNVVLSDAIRHPIRR